MSRSDAASMLGVSPTANRSEVDAAYRRLMVRVHPDLGGAAGLAAQLNAARATMLSGEG
jgi:curved DNA-binding protein CbpA